MAILEKIRSRSLFLILVIGLALFAFVISGVFTSNGAGGKSVIGEVNGESISREEFGLMVENTARRLGPNATTLQAVNQVWNQEVRQLIMEQQFDELGIRIEKDQILEVVKANPALASDPAFQNEAGVFDENKFIEFIAQLRANNPAGYQQWQLQEDALINAQMERSYFNLIKAGVGSTLKDGELNYHFENDKVDISYVKVPYSSIADSTVTVTDNEIKEYIKEHEDEFMQEPSRDIRYVFFAEEPSEEDIAAIEEEITALIDGRVVFDEAANQNDTLPGFRTTTQVRDFVNVNSDIEFDSTYVAKKDLPAAYADSIFVLEKGEVFGPYKDGDFYKITRLIDRKEGAMVKASHILLAYDGSGAQPKESRTKEEAEALAQDLLKQVNADPSEFGTLALEYSDDPGSSARGGTYDDIPEGMMVPEFNDYIFGNPVGSTGVVETEFGYHVIKVDDKYQGVQLATIAREIEPSEKTLSDLFTETTKFEMDAAEQDFKELAEVSDYALRPVRNIQPLNENIAGIGNQRSLVQWAFNDDTKVGAVKRFSVSGGYVVAQLTAKRKEGLARPQDVAFRVKPVIMKRKKAEIIKEKYAGETMADLAKAAGVNVASASGLTMKTPNIAGAGREPKVVGIALAMKEGATSDLIEGEQGVFMIEVTEKEIAPSLDNYITYSNSQKTLNRNRVFSAAYNALKEQAEIEDDRAEVY
ncbi:peptidylprolyl isomerase [Robertkochia aurantiaca]|uniref:peptidylprolyl isomerase n=1 Tax=Robertkochia aurantiaca TaxID=2873700 RepID=UPI001CCFE54F|nr:peptidylprolyl isomerase [Robertkochia sp. 3YJGBD-33]